MTFTKDTVAGYDILPAERDRSETGFTDYGFVAAKNKRVKRLKLVRRRLEDDYEHQTAYLNQSTGQQWNLRKESQNEQTLVTRRVNAGQRHVPIEPERFSYKRIISENGGEILVREEEIYIQQLNKEVPTSSLTLEEVLNNCKEPTFEKFVRDKMTGRLSKHKISQVARWIRLGEVGKDMNETPVNSSRVEHKASSSTITGNSVDCKKTTNLSFKMKSALPQEVPTNQTKKFDFDLTSYQKLYQARVTTLRLTSLKKAQSQFLKEEFFHTDETLIFPLKDHRFKAVSSIEADRSMIDQKIDSQPKRVSDDCKSDSRDSRSDFTAEKDRRRCRSCHDLTEGRREANEFPDLQVESDCYLMPVKIEVDSCNRRIKVALKWKLCH